MIPRHCFSKLPQHLLELQDGPRHGDYTRAGFQPASDAAGHPFPKGAPSCHVLFDGRPFPKGEPNVNGSPHKRKDFLTSSDHTGAAGCGSPPTEVRAFTVDDHVRRAQSEPPESYASCAVQLLAMQNHGVFPGIDSQVRGHRRCLSPERHMECRSEVRKRAMKFGDITDISKKKHFNGVPSPGASSPRFAAVALESVDIDARAGRAHLAEPPVEGILPTRTPSFCLDCRHKPFSAAPRRPNMRYFEKSLEAERYAQRIGRPHHAAASKELQRVRLALGLDRQEIALLDIAAEDIQDCIGSVATPSELSVDAAPSKLQTLSLRAASHLLSPAEIGAPVKDAGLSDFCHSRQSSLQSTAVPSLYGSEASRFSHSRQSSMQEFEGEPRLPHSNQTSLREFELESLVPAYLLKAAQSSQEEFESKPAVSWKTEERPHQLNVPLGLRRIMASLMPNPDMMTEDLMDDLGAALAASVQQLGKSQAPNSKSDRSLPKRSAKRSTGVRH